ncbi:MAG: beta-galactosidase [Lachnospiraceae bacterium]|nr:beta-galactosidase [Lachnospiraceae bacterium]
MNVQTEKILPKFTHLLYGGDYNPDQWFDNPEILTRDIELMKKANVNCVSLGIFAWAKLEPKRDEFHLEWLEEIINRLHLEGIYTILATPSGARPRWLANEYIEVLRVDERGKRAHFGGRHNHCISSKKYRERVYKIDAMLAKRFGSHPAVIMWHISNEYEGECHCNICQDAFRGFLKQKYGSIEKLNSAWWTSFWSHDYTDFAEIESPTSIGENSINGLLLDWKRFVTSQTTDFMNNEIVAVKKYAQDIPVTTNMMGLSDVLCYPKLAKKLDIISWDSYPEWHEPGKNIYQGVLESFTHDYMRCLKKQPFILMESTPSTVNWRPVCKIKKPGMHRLSMLNAIGHGSQSAMCFQIRQSLGGAEKFHSAVISHCDSENTRVFKEVSELGKELSLLSEMIYKTYNKADVAIIYDKENKWALDNSCGPRNAGLDYNRECVSYYAYFWKQGINVDVIDSSSEIDGYKLVITPMLYMYHNNIQEKIRKYVDKGGYIISTAFSGYVDENDLCFWGENNKERLSDVYGIWVEEIDALYDGEYNQTCLNGKEYKLDTLCEIVHCTSAKSICDYGKDFYKGKPVVTVNDYGLGKAYHMASNPEQSLINELLAMILKEICIDVVLANTNIPDGIGIVSREDDEKKIIFIGNFSEDEQEIKLDKMKMDDSKKMLYNIDGSTADETISFGPYEMKMLIEK